MFCNIEFQDSQNFVEVEHFARDGSDHTPLFISCTNTEIKFQKSFKFLNFWVEHFEFIIVVRRNWGTDYSDNLFHEFKKKIKKVKRALSEWSRNAFRDIFQQLEIKEETTKLKESCLKKYLLN